MIAEDDDRDLDAIEEEFIDPTGRTRPLMKGEVVPHIPTLYEQLDMARRHDAAARSGKR